MKTRSLPRTLAVVALSLFTFQLAVASGIVITTGTITLSNANLSTTGDMQINGGSLILNVSTVSLNGSWSYSSGTFNAGTSLVQFNGTTAGKTITTGNQAFHDVHVNGNGSWTLQDPMTLTGAMYASAGVLDANVVGNHEIKVATGWHNQGGTYSAHGATVTVTGNALITGNTTFNHFQAVTAGQTLTFQAGSTTTVNGLFTLTGVPGNRVQVRSSVTGVYAFLINVLGNNVSYATPQDNNASAGIAIAAGPTSVDGGHTQNWFFGTCDLSNPKRPNGILSTLLAAGSQVLVDWKAVTKSVSGNATQISNYLVERTTNLLGAADETVNVGSTLSYTESRPGVVEYYRVKAYDGCGKASAWSDYVDSTDEANRLIFDASNLLNKMTIPHNAALQLRSENNSFGMDLEMTPSHQIAEEHGAVVTSVLFQFNDADSGMKVPGFSFTGTAPTVQLDYTASQFSLGGQSVAMYWYNGASFVKLTNPTLASTQTVLWTANMGTGKYQIRTADYQRTLKVTQAYPKMITPRDPSQNNTFHIWYESVQGQTVSGDIFDLHGARVRTLSSSNGSSLEWNGKDENGSLAPIGVYLYRVSAGNDVVTGTVVVVR